MFKRLFDIVSALFGFITLFPLFLLVSLLIVVDSRGGIFYRQIRVGKGGKDFKLIKFRTMFADADKKGLLTVGMKDSRVTKAGCYLRKYKLDEFPQLLNVLMGDMSIVGPRPEVRKYVDMYSVEQQKILDVKPGITDYASIEFANENELLGRVNNPEEVYINEIMPAKLNLNLKYIRDQSFATDLKIIFRTLRQIIT